MLTLIKETGYRKTPSGSKRKMGLFKCRCGNTKEISLYNAKNGVVKSCGCLNKEKIKALGRIKGKERGNYKHGMFGTRFYSIYHGIKMRCSKKSPANRKYYSDKGIECEWKSFIDFKDDMYDSYLEHTESFGEKETTIDRIDSDKNYCKENCKWATRIEQAKEKCRYLVYKGVKKSIRELSKESGIKRATILSRINKGWSIEDSVNKPLVN